MNPLFKPFLIVISGLSTFLSIVAYYWFAVRQENQEMWATSLSLILIFAIVVLLANRHILKTKVEQPEKIVRATMLVTTLKFLAYFVIMIVFVFSNEQKMYKQMFAVMGSLYVIFTIVEKIFVLNKLKSQ